MAYTLTTNPRIVLPVMLVGLAVFTVLAWSFLFTRILVEASLEQDASTFARTTGTVVAIDTLKRSGRRSTSFEPVVEYRFEVEGVEYRGSRLQAFPALFRRPAEAGLEASNFPPDSRVTVHYDPADPRRSVLRIQPGPQAGKQKMFAIAFAAFIGLAWIILLAKACGLWLGRR